MRRDSQYVLYGEARYEKETVMAPVEYYIGIYQEVNKRMNNTSHDKRNSKRVAQEYKWDSLALRNSVRDAKPSLHKRLAICMAVFLLSDHHVDIYVCMYIYICI
jgi:hypothetical protein